MGPEAILANFESNRSDRVRFAFREAPIEANHDPNQSDENANLVFLKPDRTAARGSIDHRL